MTTYWIDISDISTIKFGDVIKGYTMTHSQKWIKKDGYGDCNKTTTGIVISKDHKTKYDIQIYDLNEQKEISACVDVGTDGFSYLQKFSYSKV